ncbi:MAG: hypothetical protein ACRDP4_08445, partial [Nocardioidaceae bacterium]
MRRTLSRVVVLPAVAAVVLTSAVTGPTFAATPAASPDGARTPSSAVTRTLDLPEGSTVKWHRGGSVVVTDQNGNTRPLPMPGPTGRSGLGKTYKPSDRAVAARATAPAYQVGSATMPGTPARIQPMNTGGIPLPKASAPAARKRAKQAPAAAAASIPRNDGLTSSFQSYLNASGINVAGTFADARKYLHALPGAGEIVTNVSLGDLTDQTMADAGDQYVKRHGPTTILRDGQRYLDIPTMPLIPTYVADSEGHLDPTGSTEGQDPKLAEVLLDFSMMAPLPHRQQRPGATGRGLTDLLGIAPGADYRLVVPKVPSSEGVAAALR